MNSWNVELFGSDQKVQKAIMHAKNVSVLRAPVLVQGEIGTGKRMLAQYIHDHSGRKDRGITIVDCSLERSEVENSILGHRDEESGKFFRGALESTNGGTVVLANIDSLDDEFQKKLYKILLDLQDYDLDIRIIGTTTRNLSKLVGAGRFFRALYTFLSDTVIIIPPLRDRPEDLQKIIQQCGEEIASELGKEFRGMSDEVRQKLMGHYWSQNHKELRTALKLSIERDDDGYLDLKDIVFNEKRARSLESLEEDDGLKLMSLREAEKLLIKKALIHTSENRTQAAKILGVSIRTLRNKINEYRGEGTNFFINLR